MHKRNIKQKKIIRKLCDFIIFEKKSYLTLVIVSNRDDEVIRFVW